MSIFASMFADVIDLRRSMLSQGQYMPKRQCKSIWRKKIQFRKRILFLMFEIVNDQVPTYLHNRPALDHFWAIRPDSHLTISIFAWYLPLKDWNLYYVFAHLLAIWPFLSLFDPTRTRPFAICIDLYSTNLVSVHSLVKSSASFETSIISFWTYDLKSCSKL